MKLAACRTLPRFAERGSWYRAVPNRFFPTAFSYIHTKLAQSRFNAGSQLPPADQFPTFYLAEDPVTALFEVGAVLGTFSPGAYVSHPHLAHSMLAVQVDLQEIIDLTEPVTAHQPLETTAQELTGDWRGYSSRGPLTSLHAPTGLAPTQELGQTIYNLLGVEGFVAVSSKVPFNKTLVVFPDKMRSGSSLVYRDHVTGVTVHEIRP